ncbi:MAG TPA: LLM class F420-dependent oxidoreductase [Burkholderiales bacterium]|nr:LLM class F420-dependent oxidoreductase [Burkholderiales bacterium]
MQVGFSTMNNIHLARPDDVARMVEERGFDSLWLGEHAHIPKESDGTYPGSADRKIPEPYKAMGDPFVSLAMAAAATKKLKLGMGVALPLERDVFSTAKAVATLDQLSGGRVLMGVGVGWSQKEFENTAKMPWVKRYSGLRECVQAMRALWTQEEATFHGEWYHFDKVWCNPKPLQKPWPPIYVGMAGPTGTAHMVEWGDAWYPIDIGAKDYGNKLERFRNALRAAGRDPAKVPVTLVLMGDADLDKMKRYRDLGIERLVVNVGSQVETNPLKKLDQYAEMIPKLK